jgi:type VI secretion system protein ImpF
LARRSQAPRLEHSLWDRLIDPEVTREEGLGVDFSSAIERIRDEVRRDLEWLLNARRPLLKIPEGMATLEKSLVTYGLPDFTGMNLAIPAERDRLERILATAIRDFEPRLSNVEVSFNPLRQDQSRFALHYRIDAMLRVDPAPVPVVFDTVLELASRAFVVESEA